MRKFSYIDWKLLLIGMFSMTQIRVIGSIGISELVICLIAPVMFIQDLNQLRKDGFMPILMLALLTCISCCISCYVNATPFEAGIRGFASPYVLWAGLVVMHRCLLKNLNGLRWFIVGFAISTVINTFTFQTGADMATFGEGGQVDAQVLMSGPLFWVSKLRHFFLDIPIGGFYIVTPLIYSILAPLGLVAFTFATSDSGRAMALSFFATSMLLIVGRKRVEAMKSISKHFVLVGVAMICAAAAFKALYKYAATHGYLTEKAEAKYAGQSKGGTGFLQLLMAGRGETFIGGMAALRKPVWGYGPWPIDKENISEEYLMTYGTEEDINIHLRTLADYARFGITMRQHWLPCHSHIIGFWVWYGAIGGVLWLYVLYLIYKFLRYDVAIMPQWFGYFSFMIPTAVWNICFSPFGSRMYMITLITSLLLADAIRRGKVFLSLSVVAEINRYR
ncbi:MAG: hypothetical protein IJI54_14580 [Kiritimatiellae bacterium]|nr:hypothetical protein [Kiritimatiellia bacterium]